MNIVRKYKCYYYYIPIYIIIFSVVFILASSSITYKIKSLTVSIQELNVILPKTIKCGSYNTKVFQKKKRAITPSYSACSLYFY